MSHIKINTDRCKGCGLCVIYCPNKLISSSETLNKKGIRGMMFKDNENKCAGCCMCAVICPDCAIEVWKES